MTYYRATGLPGRENDVYSVFVPHPVANVVVFLGDAQHLRENMLKDAMSHPWAEFNVEMVAQAFAERFPEASIHIVFPSRRLGPLAFYRNFLDVTDLAETRTPQSPSTIYEDSFAAYHHMLWRDPAAPLVLAGFSRGGCVVTQLVRSMLRRRRGAGDKVPPLRFASASAAGHLGGPPDPATWHSPVPQRARTFPCAAGGAPCAPGAPNPTESSPWTPSAEADPSTARAAFDPTPSQPALAAGCPSQPQCGGATPGEARFGTRAAAPLPRPGAPRLCEDGPAVLAVHWLDAGNGKRPGALPVDAESLSLLPTLGGPSGVTLCLHGTPYMWGTRHRKWLPRERDTFADAARAAGLAVGVHTYLTQAPAEVDTHFLLLRAFRAGLPAAAAAAAASASAKPDPLGANAPGHGPPCDT